MRNILIMKIAALGDIVRTTPILHKFKNDSITWFTSEKGTPLLKNNPYIKRVLTEKSLNEAHDTYYDIVLNMDEELECCILATSLMNHNKVKEFYGFYADNGFINYKGKDTDWLDISLSGKFNKEKADDPRWKNKADELKWHNRRSYEDHMFSILGFKFNGEEYILNYEVNTKKGFVGIQNPLERNTKWPMKQWNNYESLATEIKKLGYEVRFLGLKISLEEHINDIAECEYVICEDSLPMQIATALKKPTIALFICTSPYEIHSYNRVTKIVSPKLKEYFYRRDFDPKAAETIPLKTVMEAFKNVVNNNTSI